MNEKRELEQELDSVYDNISKGAQIRSKAKWISEGERNTSFFLGLEKKHQTNNTLLEIKNDNNIFTSNEASYMKCALSMRIYTQANISMMKISPLICKMLHVLNSMIKKSNVVILYQQLMNVQTP